MALHSRQELWFSFKDSCVSVLECLPPPTHYRQNLSLLFLHGRFGQADMWQPLISNFANQFRCLAVDFPGFGRSFSARRRAFSLLEHANLINELIHKLSPNGNKVVLVGHDFGGGIAQLCALKSPEKISGLVLINSACITQALGELNTDFRGWWLKRHLRNLLKEAKTMHPDHKAALSLPWLNYYSRNTLIEAFRALDDSWPWHYERQTWRSALPTIQRPVLLLWGKNDEISPPDMAHDLIQRLPDTYFFLHEQSGHWPSLEQPEWVLSKMKEFIFQSHFGQTEKPKSGQRFLSR